MRLSILILKLIITTTNFSVFRNSYVNGIKLIDPEKIPTSSGLFEDFSYPNDYNNNFSYKSIFFIQQYNRIGINCREACSIESAAVAHPHYQINVFLPTHGSTKELLKSIPIIAVLNYDNINFYKAKLAEYINRESNDTKLMKCSTRDKKCPNLLKYLTLNKYPGIYIDLDLLVIQALDTFPSKNWVGQEEDRKISDGLISFSDDQIGRVMANVTLSILEDSLNKGRANTEDLVRRSHESICSVAHLTEDAQIVCDGFKIYNKDYFKNITMKNFHKYFGHLNMTNVYTIRVYYEPPVTNNPQLEMENQDKLFVRLAKEYCPWVNKLCGLQHKTNVLRTKFTFPLLNSKKINVREYMAGPTIYASPDPEEVSAKAKLFSLDDYDDEEVIDHRDEFWINDLFESGNIVP